MTADGTPGVKNQPQFTNGGAPDLAVDSNLLADYSAKVGNRQVGTTTERNAATGKDLWEQKLWGDTTDLGQYVYSGSAWQRLLGGHAEFTASSGPANATPFGVGAVTADTGNTNDTTFVSPIQDGLRFLRTGIYAITVAGNLTAAATGRSYAGIENFAATVFYARAGIPVGENIFSVHIPNLRIDTVNTDVALTLFQTTGATRTIATRIRVSKVG